MTKKSSNGQVDLWPEDLDRSWLSVCRALQAACTENNGFGILNISIAVSKKRPVLWSKPGIELISPMSAADQINPEIIAALYSFVGSSDE